MTPRFSFVIQTRLRREILEHCIDSLLSTVVGAAADELILGVDDDDPSVDDLRVAAIPTRVVRLPKGIGAAARMSALALQAHGDWVFFLNDDLEFPERGWDQHLIGKIGHDVSRPTLVHLNDGVLGEQLCIYPCLSRAALDVLSPLIPVPYKRWWADDHLHNVFYLLGILGFARIRYFGHLILLNDFGRAKRGHPVQLPRYSKEFREDIRLDQTLFVRSFEKRVDQALALAQVLAPQDFAARATEWRARLAVLPIFRRQTLYYKWPRRMHRRLFWPLLKNYRLVPLRSQVG